MKRLPFTAGCAGFGVTVRKTVDLWIATWCIASGVPLLHQDRDFSAIARHEPGLIEVPVPGR
ncbi:MAG: hypothetical protein U5L06_00340 [Rhodovibrio sp.]|nr:hypothetical protein [Rhodovibrio sp.]